MSAIGALLEVRTLARSKLAARGETRPGEFGERAGHGIHNMDIVVAEALELVGRDNVIRRANLSDPLSGTLKAIASGEFGDVELETLKRHVDILRPTYTIDAFRCIQDCIETNPRKIDSLETTVSDLVAFLRASGWSDAALRNMRPLTADDSDWKEMMQGLAQKL
ncbi:MAG TPA: hypothetical protein VK034_30010, partial [Enhygromyxa sp.]|nr:hypothetical protein [Enhygromyxa sp.]